MKSPFTLTAAATALLALALTGCDSSGSGSTPGASTGTNAGSTSTTTGGTTGNTPDTSTNNNVTTLTPSTGLSDVSADTTGINAVPASFASGKVVDGYVRSALVCLDVNHNNECDDDEPFSRTRSDGSYKLDVSGVSADDRNKARVIVIGGIDSDTGLPFSGVLRAPLRGDAQGHTHVSPLTTLLSQKVTDNSVNLSSALTDLNNELELSLTDTSLLTADPVAYAATDGGALLLESVRVQKVIELLTETVRRSGGSYGDANEAVIEALATALNNVTSSSVQAASTDRLTSAVSNMSTISVNGTSVTIPAGVRTTAANASSTIRGILSRGSGNSAQIAEERRAALSQVARQVEQVRVTITNTTSTELDNFTATTITAPTEDPATLIRNANLRRLLDLASAEVDESGFSTLSSLLSSSNLTADTSINQFGDLLDSLSGLSDEQQALVDNVMRSVSNASLLELADTLNPASFDALLQNGFYDFDFDWDNQSIAAGVVLFNGNREGDFLFKNRTYDLANKEFSSEMTDDFDGDDAIYIWNYSTNQWVASSERYKITNDGTLQIWSRDINGSAPDQHNTDVRITAVENLQGKTQPLSIWDLENTYRVTFTNADAQRYALETTNIEPWVEHSGLSWPVRFIDQHETKPSSFSACEGAGSVPASYCALRHEDKRVGEQTQQWRLLLGSGMKLYEQQDGNSANPVTEVGKLVQQSFGNNGPTVYVPEFFSETTRKIYLGDQLRGWTEFNGHLVEVSAQPRGHQDVFSVYNAAVLDDVAARFASEVDTITYQGSVVAGFGSNEGWTACQFKPEYQPDYIRVVFNNNWNRGVYLPYSPTVNHTFYVLKERSQADDTATDMNISITKGRDHNSQHLAGSNFHPSAATVRAAANFGAREIGVMHPLDQYCSNAPVHNP